MVCKNAGNTRCKEQDLASVEISQERQSRNHKRILYSQDESTNALPQYGIKHQYTHEGAQGQSAKRAPPPARKER